MLIIWIQYIFIKIFISCECGLKEVSKDGNCFFRFPTKVRDGRKACKHCKEKGGNRLATMSEITDFTKEEWKKLGKISRNIYLVHHREIRIRRSYLFASHLEFQISLLLFYQVVVGYLYSKKWKIFTRFWSV